MGLRRHWGAYEALLLGDFKTRQWHWGRFKALGQCTKLTSLCIKVSKKEEGKGIRIRGALRKKLDGSGEAG